MTSTDLSHQISAEFTLPDHKKTNRSGPIRWILSHFKRYWYIGVLILVGAYGNAYLAAVVPIEIGKSFNAIIESPSGIDILLASAWTIVWTQLVRGVLQFGRNFSAEWLGQLFERDIRDELFVNLLGKSMTFHNLQPVGDTMARATNDVREINFMFSPGINLVVGSANFILLPIIMAPNYHPSLIITPLVFLVLYFLLIWQYLHELNPVSTKVRRAFGKLNTRLAEALDGIETVKGMAQEQSEIKRFENNAEDFRDYSVRQGDIEARYLPLLLLGIASAAGLLHSLLLFQRGAISAGDVIGYFGLLQLFGFPTFASIFAYSQVSLGIAGAQRILDLINKETDLDQNISGHFGEMRGDVTFEDVCFAYEDDKEYAIKDVSFSVKAGQTVAIVGQTGTGKTSLVKLINRTYDVDSGVVKVDGIDVRDWQLASLRRQVSIIEQDIFLFSRPIKDNIAFGAPEATEEEIIAAAKAAQAHDFILEFKDGYDTVIGERGVTLSGGQRQRLALARAFLTDPRILVLDDSTSAIDSATEDKIQRAIYAAAKGRTTFLITPRLSQIRWADLIIVMGKGEVVAIGTHEELLAYSEAYRRIFSE